MKQLYSDISEPVKELSTLVFNHFGKNPMGWTGIDKLTEYAHDGQFIRRVFDLYNYLTSTKELLVGINPSQYYKIIYKFQLASKSSDYNRDAIIECYFYLANYAIQVYNHYYWQIERFVKTNTFIDVSSEWQVKKITFLCAALRSYSEVLYCDEHTIAGEIYSPIMVKDGIVIVRKYRWLKAYELRMELIDCPYHAINIYIKYKKMNNSLSTDIVGNLLTDVNISENICGFYIELLGSDEKVIAVESWEAIDEIILYFQNIIPLLSNNYKKMSLQSRLWMKILCEYYAMKPYTDVCGREWRPMPYLLDIKEIENRARPIVNVNKEIEDMCDKNDIMKKLFELNDPRVHWK